MQALHAFERRGGWAENPHRVSSDAVQEIAHGAGGAGRTLLIAIRHDNSRECRERRIEHGFAIAGLPCVKILEAGVPLQGVCLYPILGMPEWHSPEEWTRMGLWDLQPKGESLQRVLHMPMFKELQKAQSRVKRTLSPPVRSRRGDRR